MLHGVHCYAGALHQVLLQDRYVAMQACRAGAPTPPMVGRRTLRRALRPAIMSCECAASIRCCAASSLPLTCSRVR